MNVLTAKSELEGVLHGTSNSQITGLNGVFNRAARQVLLDLDPQETIRYAPVFPLYDEVYDYVCPADLKGNKVIDIRPNGARQLRDRFDQSYSQDFDRFKGYTFQDNFNVDFNSGVKTIKIDAPSINKGVTISNADGVSTNGTFIASGTASNISTDTINYIGGSGSVSFDIATGTGIITDQTLGEVDLSAHENQSNVFFDIFLPTASLFSSITIKWGSSASAYWERTLTTNQEGTAFQDGWNLMSAQWFGATKVGSPDSTKVNYLQVSYVYTGTPTMPGVKLNYVVSRLGTYYEIEYYSKFLFRDSITGAFQETVTNDSNLINLDTETYNIFFYQLGFLCVQQMLGQDAAYDTQIFLQKYNEAVQKYKTMYKSQVQKPKTMYYNRTSGPYRRWFGRPYNY